MRMLIVEEWKGGPLGFVGWGGGYLDTGNLLETVYGGGAGF